MAKRRVHEIAKEKGISSKEVLAALQAAGLNVKAAASSVDESVALKALEAANGGAPAAQAEAPAATEAAPPKEAAAKAELHRQNVRPQVLEDPVAVYLPQTR